MELFEKLEKTALDLGASKAKVIEVRDIVFNREFRMMCERNECGYYGRNWMCPPDVGEIDAMIDEIKQFQYALVYQTISNLEDSFDVEGMNEAFIKHNKLVFAVQETTSGFNLVEMLNVGAGECSYCEKCAKTNDEPCRFPEKAISSLEAHGIWVQQLANTGGMKYINGTNTVTYFGALFFNLNT